ncbi:serine/arginine repetitive matrix protein 2-like [Papaver somniferum]|uniref:serine/arginine repetitive matrix protein 2-like n=1 Tax=Papaver somniferum TaxID=3469 RepID=UPI000E702FCE|nr:serine/arginine repetitive matrix protein 2-like [Papaver somniferum]
MNRSFIRPIQQENQTMRSNFGNNNNTVMIQKKKKKEDNEEELALFLEMRKREKDRSNLLNSGGQSLGSKLENSPIYKIVSSARPRKADEFLNSENDKSDYDWLITPPRTPLFPSLEMDAERNAINRLGLGTPKARQTSLKSKLANSQVEIGARGNPAFRQQPPSSPGLHFSSAGTRRPASSGGRLSTASRPATPTRQPTLSLTANTSRPSTPTSRPTLPASKSMALSGRFSNPSARSSTPTSRMTAPPSKSVSRSATPTRRPSATSCLLVPRSMTPTRRPSTPSKVSSVSAPLSRSSSVSKSGPTTTRNPVPARGSSPTVKSRPWKLLEMPGFSLEAPPNLRTSVPERPASASRGRPQAPNVRSSVECGSNGRPRRQSCSPSRGRAPNSGIHSYGSSAHAVSQARYKGTDNPNPVLSGTKMVDRVVNMRRPAPTKQDDLRTGNNPVRKSSPSLDGSNFGRSLSGKSLDMAMRHMDIKRSVSGSSLRPKMTSIPASSLYSVRSGPARTRTLSMSDSPITTCSTASSEQSVNNATFCLYDSELEDDLNSERGGRFYAASLQGR